MEGEDVIGNGHSDIRSNGENNLVENNEALDGDESDAFGHSRGDFAQLYAKMPVGKYDPYYNMKHPKRGLALIFNHEKFECQGLKPRSGTNADCKNLKETLSGLGFEVHEFKDLNVRDVMANVEEVAKMDHSNHDCICITVLSHGENNIIYAKDAAYKPDNLWAYFTGDKCRTLAGKPKIFFLQACQGDKLDSGINMIGRTETDGQTHNSYKIPAQADFLIVYSTFKDYYSWRNTTNGSWFVQSLCAELKNRAHHSDLLTILTFVSQRVALDFESNVPDNPAMHRQKQIPCIMSMLTRLILFGNKGLDAEGNNIAITETEKNKSIFKIFNKNK